MIEPKRIEALLSEYKGNIFEYLMAVSLSQKFGCEKDLMLSLTPDMASMLEQQESFLRNYYPYLLVELPKLAFQACDELCSACKIGEITKISLVGKLLAGINGNRFDEADLILQNSKEALPISIKISKMNSYVNSKSAGVRTFFVKYFSEFNVEKIQIEFNRFCDFKYEEMAIKMHREAGISYIEGFKNWEKEGKEVLPGQLPENEKEYLLEYYSIVNKKISGFLKELYRKDKGLFKKSIWPLVGYSNPEIIQVTAFYKLDKNVFNKTKISIHQMNEAIELKEFIERKNNLDLVFDEFILQIRLKPMNKFTSKSFKINCAVKYLG